MPFPAVTCISLNEQVVHGIPGQRQLREGDLVKIDTACKLNGWCADAAVSLPVGEIAPLWGRLLEVGQQVLSVAITEMGHCRWWSEVAIKMQKQAENAGFSVVKQYVGHGIGRIVCTKIRKSPISSAAICGGRIFGPREGLVLAVEPMVNMGKSDTRVLADHWTVVTRDGLPSVHVEHTLAITRQGVQILNAPPEQ